MKTIIRYAVSCFEKLTGLHHLTATAGVANIVAANNDFALGKKQSESSMDCNHRQVGILYADIVDYSRLTEQDEEGTHRRLVESMALMEAYVAANNGRVAHFAGDAILAEFEDADNALNCAINMQISDRQRNADLSPDRRILFRIGINYGDVIADQGDIYGNAVNLAARLEKLAHSGGICVSESVRIRLKSSPSFKFTAIGRHHVKNLSEPVQAFGVDLEAE